MAGVIFTFRVGGRDWASPRLVFRSLRAAWPHIKTFIDAIEPVEKVDAALEILGAALMAAENPEDRANAFSLGHLLEPEEWQDLLSEVDRMVAASLPKPPAELAGGPGTGEAVASSTATSIPSSPSSPPEASAVATPAA